MMAEGNRSNMREYMLLILAFIAWGSTYVVSKLLLNEFPVFFVAFCRYLIAWIFLSVFLCVRGRTSGVRPRHYDRRGITSLVLFGLIGYTLSIDLQFAGTKLIPAATASLINASNPVGITLLSCIFLKEPLTRLRVFGICLGIFGVYLIVGNAGGVSDPLGLFFSVAAVVLWSAATIISRKELTRFDPVKVTRDGMCIAVICNLFLCAGELISTDISIRFSPLTLLGLLYLGTVCTAGTHLLWNRALGKLPAHICSSFYPIQPLSATVLGVFFLHETVGISFFIGAAFIAAGILLSLHEKKSGN